MNVFVSEYLSSGACPLTEQEASLLVEGTAMLEAVLIDLLRVPGVCVQTCVRDGLLTSVGFRQAEQDGRLQIQRIMNPEQESKHFQSACQQADLALIIAPEFDELLATRTRLALETGVRVLGPDLELIRLTADKWRLFHFLQSAGIPTIATTLLATDHSVPAEFPCLIKHRFGAGGLGIARFNQWSDWQQLPKLQEQGGEFILQPYLPGRALSAVALIQQGRCELFPIGEQCLHWNSGCEYRGGVIPAQIDVRIEQSIQELLQQTCSALPGLAGYVGFDILVPDATPLTPLLVEINPRFTTSYTGYRQLTPANLAQRMIEETGVLPPLRWNAGQTVQFQPDGSFQIQFSE